MDATRLAQEYANLASVYDPQKALVQQQISAVPGQYEAQKTALEQAKANAFRDITSAAQGRGVYFSGFRPEQEARYTGERFLPALANLSTQQQQATFNLQKALADIETAQRQAATTNLQNILNREQQQKQFEQQLALSRAQASAAGGGGGLDIGSLFGALGAAAGAGGASTPGAAAAAYRVEKAGNGYNFFDPSGKPISAVKYAQGIGQGGNFKTFLQDLAKTDKNAQLALKFADVNYKNVPTTLRPALEALGIGATYKDYGPYFNNLMTNYGPSLATGYR